MNVWWSTEPVSVSYQATWSIPVGETKSPAGSGRSQSKVEDFHQSSLMCEHDGQSKSNDPKYGSRFSTECLEQKRISAATSQSKSSPPQPVWNVGVQQRKMQKQISADLSKLKKELAKMFPQQLERLKKFQKTWEFLLSRQQEGQGLRVKG